MLLIKFATTQTLCSHQERDLKGVQRAALKLCLLLLRTRRSRDKGDKESRQHHSTNGRCRVFLVLSGYLKLADLDALLCSEEKYVEGIQCVRPDAIFFLAKSKKGGKQ